MKILTDKNNNKCSVDYWGSESAAQKALDSLENCSGCSDCSHCSRCSHCSGCSRCSDCSGCSHCSGCSGLKGKSPLGGAPVVPTIPDIHKRIYEAVSKPEALEMTTWHTCNTTHCRGGWVVTLAGKEGAALEAFHGTLLAAMLIYDASDPNYRISPVRFYDSNENALADMKRLAEKESS